MLGIFGHEAYEEQFGDDNIWNRCFRERALLKTAAITEALGENVLTANRGSGRVKWAHSAVANKRIGKNDLRRV